MTIPTNHARWEQKDILFAVPDKLGSLIDYCWDENDHNPQALNAIAELVKVRGDWMNFQPVKNLPILNKKNYYNTPAEYISLAIQNQQPICVCLDYDCDGQTAGAALVTCLQAAGAEVSWVVPNRLIQGYGLNVELIESRAEKGSLLITVDNGITNTTEVEQLQTDGYEVIITDHHNQEGELPKAKFIVDPKLEPPMEGEEFDDEFMVPGVWVGAKLGLMIAAKVLGTQSEKFKSLLSYCCCLVTLGIISDVIELNNTIVTQLRVGLCELVTTAHKGIRALLANCGCKDNQDITSTFISYMVAPKLNAAGRMGKPELGVEILLNEGRTNKDEMLALRQANTLKYLNDDRKIIEQEIFDEAVLLADELIKKYPNILVIYRKEWHLGVLGIVAARLIEKYNIPVIVASNKANSSEVEGSCRSVNDLNLFQCLGECKDVLISFGGHDVACGLRLELDKLEDFRQKINEVVASHQSTEQKVIKFDLIVNIASLYDIRWQMFLNNLEPQGNKNECLILELVDVKIKNIEQKRNSIYITVEDNNDYILTVNRFRGDENLLRYKIDDKVCMLISPSVNYFNGTTMIEYRIVDIIESVPF